MTSERKANRFELYFAYGSNLNRTQMTSRCPSAKPIRRAVLNGYAIAFGGYSYVWGGAVASLKPVLGGRVDGLLYRIASADIDRLDRYEGCPRSYVRLTKVVVDDEEKRRRAQVYLQNATSFGEQRLPSEKYFRQILAEYHRHGFSIGPLAAAVGVTL